MGDAASYEPSPEPPAPARRPWYRTHTVHLAGAFLAGCALTSAVFLAPQLGDGLMTAAGVAPSPSPSLDRAGAAAELCKDAVKDLLKAPATAQFSDIESTKVIGSAYHLVGNVDSENGFGALIRSPWLCTARIPTSDESSWNITELNVME